MYVETNVVKVHRIGTITKTLLKKESDWSTVAKSCFQTYVEWKNYIYRLNFRTTRVTENSNLKEKLTLCNDTT